MVAREGSWPVRGRHAMQTTKQILLTRKVLLGEGKEAKGEKGNAEWPCGRREGGESLAFRGGFSEYAHRLCTE